MGKTAGQKEIRLMNRSGYYGRKPSRSYEGIILTVRKTSAKQLVVPGLPAAALKGRWDTAL